jgi:hypothetical protein
MTHRDVKCADVLLKQVVDGDEVDIPTMLLAKVNDPIATQVRHDDTSCNTELAVPDSIVRADLCLGSSRLICVWCHHTGY